MSVVTVPRTLSVRDLDCVGFLKFLYTKLLELPQLQSQSLAGHSITILQGLSQSFQCICMYKKQHFYILITRVDLSKWKKTDDGCRDEKNPLNFVAVSHLPFFHLSEMSCSEKSYFREPLFTEQREFCRIITHRKEQAWEV